MELAFAIAAGLSALTFVVHLVAGTREIKQPLMTSDMAESPRQTVFLAWHICTIALGVMAAGFGWAALAGLWEVAVLMTGFAGLSFLWALVFQVQSGLGFAALPQWSIFAAIFVSGAWGIA